MVEAVATEAPRRHLSSRQAQIVERLLDAAAAEIRAVGYGPITVRTVARRAGVAPATAYTYFSSKDHLLAEVMWRRFESLPATPLRPRRSAADRVASVFKDVGGFLADDPSLASAGTVALLGEGPDVKHVRDRIGAEVHGRLAEALGDQYDPAVLSALELAYTGAMLTAGLGHASFGTVPDRLAVVARLLLGSTR